VPSGGENRTARLRRPANVELRPREYLTDDEAPSRPGGLLLAHARQGTRAIQAWLGHRNIQHTTRYTELTTHRFKDLWQRED
jgi:hypothetical protein